MSSAELNAARGESVDAAEAASTDSECHELKSLLDTIAAQLSDADRRHTQTLNAMQDRIASMGRETELLRNSVPEKLSSAFERIESGVAELAQRLGSAEVGEGTQSSDAASAAKCETPIALRSAVEPSVIVATETQPRRRTPAVDTFDVIESSYPGHDPEPWDRESAEALTNLYESGDAAFTPEARCHAQQARDQDLTSPADRTAPQATMSTNAPADQVWLEGRFAEIARTIEKSLADIRLDHGFFALSQRLDQFEQHFDKVLEGVATHTDIGTLRLLGEHVGAVVSRLAKTHDQLARLSAVEEQLAEISRILTSGPRGTAGTGSPADALHVAASINVEAIARAAADEAAQRVADMRSVESHSGELRPLLEQMLAESRQGDENTAILFDTLQQAVIRLLDRVDAIELSLRQRQTAPPAPRASELETTRFNIELQRNSEFSGDTENFGFAEPTVVPPLPAEPQPVAASLSPENAPATALGGNDKLRHDLIAEIRRAKQRLAEREPRSTTNEAQPPAQTISAAPADTTGPSLPPGSRPVRPTSSAASVRASGPSAPSPRLIAIAVAAVLALTSLWYWIGSGSDQSVMVRPADHAPTAGSSASPAADTGPADRGSIAPASPADGENVDDRRSDAMERRGESEGATTIGQIISPEVPVTRTALPMLGVAVDLDQPVTQADVELAKRHQAMARMSGEIGNAVAKANGAPVIPASLVPDQSEVEGETAASTGDVPERPSHAARLELPPATVGPLSLRLAAAKGDPSAEFEVGARLAEGKGTTQNFNEAAKWYQRAAERGFAPAEYRLATFYERGLGLKEDRSLAALWYGRAASQGNVKAMHNLAVLSASQNGQAPDYTTAAQWFEEAAKRGLFDSQFNLAILYENGLGVQRDLKRAFMWLSLAARDGDVDAVRRRDILRGKLTADEMSAAEQMIAGWKPVPLDPSVNDARAAGQAWQKNPKNGISG
jgi:localization factor PodJL